MKASLPFRSLISNVVLCVGLFLISGCSDAGEKTPPTPAIPRGKVHGKLTVAGNPAPEGSVITFATTKGETGTGKTDASGVYTASDVPAGSVTVMVSGPSMKADGTLAMDAGGGIPDKYGTAATSGEKVEVKADGDVEYNLDMKKP